MDGLLIKVSITDRRGLILHHIGICLFFVGGHLENHPNCGWDPKYRVLLS